MDHTQEINDLNREISDLKYELKRTNINFASLVKVFCDREIISREELFETISYKERERYPEDF